MKNKIINIITNNQGEIIPRRITESYFKKNHNKLYLEINCLFDTLLSFNAKLYLVYYDIVKIPKCIICGNDVNFQKFSKGFSKYCSMKCLGCDHDVQIKRENTTNSLYGGKFTLTAPLLLERVKNTNIIKYGIEYPQQLLSVKEKTKQTNLVKYGVEHHLQLKSQLEKQTQTNLKKFGVKNVSQNKLIVDKRNETNLIKYGTCCPAKNEMVKSKTKNTNQNKYGVGCSFQSPIVIEKSKITNIAKYGYEQPSKNELIKKKIKNSNIITKQILRKAFWSKKLSLNISDINFDELGEMTISNYCKNHETFSIGKSLLKNRLREKIDNICTICNPINNNVSIKESELKYFIENELELTCSKTRINNKEIDIMLMEYNVGIEFDGLYWHSELYKDDNYHLNKTNLCIKNNIDLLHVFEDEWTHKKEIVKSIIKSKLKILNEIVLHDNYYIKEINNQTSTEFLNKNHILGNTKSKIKIGLYNNNDLVSVVVLNILKNSSEYIIQRHCDKINTHVISGMTKLLEYITVNYDPKIISMPVDKRYFSCELFQELNFILTKIIKPNYYYFDNKKKTQHRYNKNLFRKGILTKDGFNPSDTEHEIMKKRGFLKIYDCGENYFQLFLK